jgi:ABC-type branched-subunit amino acid transport system substrate-binding protein
MKFDRRRVLARGVSMAALIAAPSLWAQSNKSIRKITLGQSVPLTGAADQIGTAYLNGAKMFFDAANLTGGSAGYKVEVKRLDDGYVPSRAASNAVSLVNEGVDALFGFVGTASCDAAYAATKGSNTLFFAPFAASDGLRATSLANVFHVRPGLADEAYKMARHCATLNQDRIAVFAEDDAMGQAGLAAVTQALVDLKRPPLVGSVLSPVNSDKVEPAVAALLKAQPQAIIQVSLFNSSAAFIRKMRSAGYGGQFLNFSVVGIDPLFSALGKEIGGIVISQVVPSPRSVGIPLIKEYREVLGETDQTPSYESIEGYVAARAFAEGMRRSVAATGKADRAGLQKAFESMNDYDMSGFRINTRAKRYESVRVIDLVTITADGKVVR